MPAEFPPIGSLWTDIGTLAVESSIFGRGRSGGPIHLYVVLAKSTRYDVQCHIVGLDGSVEMRPVHESWFDVTIQNGLTRLA